MTKSKIPITEDLITSHDNLKVVELDNYRKYDILAKELGRLNNAMLKS
jgi:hypothetical protein